jgi:nucleoid-associated protein YgaU
MFPLADGSALQVTVLEIQSSAGKRLNGVGVVPDETVTVDLAAALPGDDPVLGRAIAILVGAMPEPPTARSYTVREGDTLKAIARRVYGQTAAWPRLYAANRAVIGDDPDALTVATTLIIPR